MSHDPSHWDVEVKENEFNYHLTLSGHTHGLQFGIEIPGFLKFSPVSFMYKYWAGLYKEFGDTSMSTEALGIMYIPEE